MMKKLCSCLLALLLMLGACAIAEVDEVATPLWAADWILPPRQYINACIVRSSLNSKWGLMTPNGDILIPFAYDNIASIWIPDYNYNSLNDFFVAYNKGGLNDASLFDANGTKLSDDTYGDFIVINTHWFLGVKLMPTEDEIVCDYTYHPTGGSGNQFTVVEYDVYHIPSGGKVGTLSRSAYEKASALGDYLHVQDRAGNLQLYNAALEPVPTIPNYFLSLASTYTSCRNIHDGHFSVFSRITDEILFADLVGTPHSTACLQNNTLMMIQTDQINYLLDLSGSIVLCGEDMRCTMTRDKRYLSIKQNGLYGLFDLATMSLVLPCEYTMIYCQHDEYYNYAGYFLVEKDSMLGYVDENNNVTCPIIYPAADMTPIGASMFTTEEDGTFKLIAADGTITHLTDVAKISTENHKNSTTYHVVQNKDGLWGIIDWHGNLKLPYSEDNSSSIEFLDQSHFIFDYAYMYEFQKPFRFY